MTVRKRLNRVIQSPWFHLALIGLLALPALWPLLTQGFPKTHDASLHLIRLHLLDEQIGAGNLFPRWLPDLMTGYGYPLFNFYAPLIYYMAETLHLAGSTLPYAISALMGILVVAAGWGGYFLAADLFADEGRRNHWAGLAAGIAYIYTPYLLVNTYVRGAAAELLAQALLPWLFWCTTRIFTTSTPLRYVTATSILLAAVALGHNITLLLLPLVLGPYVLVLLVTAPGVRNMKLHRLGQLAIGALIAAGITAFFWLPLIGERGLLSHGAFNAPVLTEHVWSFATFLETNLPYDYGVSAIPFRLGLGQVILATGGLLLTRRRSPLWWYWVTLGAICLVGITSLVLPLWRNVELLGVVQFPWRLLTFVSLSTALVTGGLVTVLRRQRWQAAVAGLVAVVAIVGGRPVIATYNMSMYADLAVDPAIVARYEAGYGAWGAGWHREFLPQWAEAFAATPFVASAAEQTPDHVTLLSVTPTGIELQVQNSGPAALRFSQFFFPGWQATVDGQSAPVYPSTQQGLVTVDLPPGDHTLQLDRAETPLESGAEWLSLIVAFTLAGVLLLRKRWWLATLALLVTLLLGLLLKAPLRVQAEPINLVSSEVLPGLHLLGYQTAVADNGRSLLIAPIWYNTRQYEDLDITWRLVDDVGAVAAQAISEPFYGSQPGTRWQPGTVVNDGYRLPLPYGAQPSPYKLQFKVDAQTEKTAYFDAGMVTAPALTPPAPVNVMLTDGQSGEQVKLAGYSLAVNGVAQSVLAAPPQVRPGDLLTVRLFWQAATELSEDYHAFVHLVDRERQPLISFDKIPGQESALPRFWDRFYAEADSYDLHIPADAEGGLYTPMVGFYDADELDRFRYAAADGTVKDAVDLAPVKVVATAAPRPQHSVQVAYGDFGQLVGWDLAPGTTSLRPGETLTVTVYYRGVQPAAADFTQFFQLYAPGSGMAAQIDQPPLRGGNPTSTWQPGETIVDQVVLTVAADAVPGAYGLNTGMYDPASGARVPLRTKDGAALPDQQTVLATLIVSE